MADTNSILWQMADQVRARLGNADLYATKVSLATAVSEQIADTISDINNRMSVLEGGGGSQTPSLTSQPVTWTNLSEIRFGTELITNTSFIDNFPISVGDVRRVTQSWTSGSVTANIGELGTVVAINNPGDIRLELDKGYAQYAAQNIQVGDLIKLLQDKDDDSGTQYDSGTVHTITSLHGNHTNALPNPIVATPTGELSFGGNGRTVFWEKVQKNLKYIWSGSSQIYNNTEREYPYYEISANLVGSTFSNDEIGKVIMFLPGNTMQNNPSWDITVGKPYTIYDVNTSNNRLWITDNAGTNITIDDENATARIRGTDWQFVQQVPHGWSIHSGEIDTTELASGNLKGVNGAVSIKQTFATPIPTGTKLAVTIGRPTSQPTGECDVIAQWNTGEEKLELDPGEAGEFIVPANKVMTGIRLATHHGSRIITDVSLFEGAIANGTAQATTSTLSKISGVDGYNAGGSSSQAIPAGQDGYFQFQYGSKTLRVGLTYQDVDFDKPAPSTYRLHLNTNGSVFADGYDSGTGFAPMGTWLRIRHYAGDNQVKFQRLQDIYSQNPNFELPTSPNNGHATNFTFSGSERPLVIALQTTNGMTVGNIYRMHVYNTSNGNGQIYELDGTSVNSMDGRGIKWEVVESAGQDYVTFHTSVDTTTNAPLYLDTSLYHIGSQINDATLVS